jgi:hypothetical protein
MLNLLLQSQNIVFSIPFSSKLEYSPFYLVLATYGYNVFLLLTFRTNHFVIIFASKGKNFAKMITFSF